MLLATVPRSHGTARGLVSAAYPACPALVPCKQYTGSTDPQCAERVGTLWVRTPAFHLAAIATDEAAYIDHGARVSRLLAFVPLSSRLTLVLTSLIGLCSCTVCMASQRPAAASALSVAALCIARGLGSGLVEC